VYRRWIEDWDGEFTGRHGRRLRIASATGSHGRAFVKCLVCGQEWMWLVLVHARGESYIVGFRKDCRDHRNVVIVNKRFQLSS